VASLTLSYLRYSIIIALRKIMSTPNQTGKVAIVTGAATGIGFASTKALLSAGFSVVMAGRRQEALNEAVKRLGSLSKNVKTIAADVGQPEAVKNLFAQTKASFGRLDVLFNNAGSGAPPLPLEDISYEQWMAVVNANLTGAFLCTQEAFKLMKSQDPMGGRIINNGSISADAPRPFSSPYTATKHAITGLTKASALDGRAYNIAVGQIDIGNAGTEMTERMKKGILQPDGSLKVEPIMDVEHVGQAVLQMANLPLESNIFHITIMATKMPYIGRA
jgi:NAD(P)-dependent dehydrogenase (short-subunit alcohol dehydrogenase family)